MKVLVTGAFGTVGQSVLAALRAQGDEVRILELDTPRSRRLARRILRPGDSLRFGDLRAPELSLESFGELDAIIHLAAIIPPAADRNPRLAREVNVEGTAALLRAARSLPRPPRFVLASSISVYGDRVNAPWIKQGDPLHPSPGDEYGRTKVEAEALVRQSGLSWVIMRLSMIGWARKLDPDPILFRMPLLTKLELCHTEDAGRAFAAALRSESVQGRILDIGGGATCRTTYRAYLDRMFGLLGLGGLSFLPEEAFAPSGFHCGWYADSDEAEELLRFRTKSLEDYYAEVAEAARWKRRGARLVGSLVRLRLRNASPYLRKRETGIAMAK